MDESGWTSYMMADTCQKCVEVVSDATTDASTTSEAMMPSSPAAGGVSIADYVTDFYARNNPSKLEDVPYILEKYKGKETELLAKLDNQYSRRRSTISGGGGQNKERLEKLLEKLEKKMPDITPNKGASTDSAGEK